VAAAYVLTLLATFVDVLPRRPGAAERAQYSFRGIRGGQPRAAARDEEDDDGGTASPPQAAPTEMASAG
jgi:hypothetical protein